jgi:hypothetical protein
MKNILIDCLGVLLYGSGFLFWPVCALLWRRKRRTTALRWVFLTQLAGNLVFAGLALLSIVKLEHGYYWFILSIFLNILFTPLAFGAAIYDYVNGERRAA